MEENIDRAFEYHERQEDLRFGALESKIDSVAKDVREVRHWVISLAVAFIGLIAAALSSCAQ